MNERKENKIKMRKSKTQKGITLIALIITIVVLLILAAVAISSITNDGILSYAQNAAKDYNQAVKNEQDMLDSYLGFLSSGEPATTFEEATKAAMLQKTVNSTVYDAYGNKIVIPAGFKIRVDDTTNNADTVTEGIVIEDEDGNQFVWIPVGKIYTDTAKTEANAKTITLGRYSSFTATDGVYVPEQTAENYATATTINLYTSYCTEDTVNNHNSSCGNSIARSIGDFVTSATQKGGYYLGRYEAGDSSNTAVEDRTGTGGTSTAGTLVCKSNQVPYNWITQPDASSKCQSMYADGYSSGTFSSDLINSYAWDTAIIFIQTFGTKSNSSTYASTVGNSSIDISEPRTTGTNILNATSVIDEQLNIYDMAGNCREWSTETYCWTEASCVERGGYTYNEFSSVERNAGAANNTTSSGAFRPLLYVSL